MQGVLDKRILQSVGKVQQNLALILKKGGKIQNSGWM
jgi:hypothetical protein